MSALSIFLAIFLALSLFLNSILFFRRPSVKTGRQLDEYLARNATGRPDISRTLDAGNGQSDNLGYFNAFLARIRDIFVKTFSIGHSLTKTSDSMKSDSGKLLDMADKTSFQATQVATAMEQMSATINEIAQNASTVATSSGRTMENANSAEHDIVENVKSIQLLAENVSTWAETNKALSRATSKIDEIILVIKDIADQTNLLALNAAIEAARAGEQGRGFAVVADEVRKLADKTAKATKEIAVMIQDIKQKADQSLQTMDTTLQGVSESIARSDSAEESLKKIVAEMKQISDMIHQMATASEEQSKVSEDVLSNMSKVSEYAAETKKFASSISGSSDAIAATANGLFSQLCGIKKDQVDVLMEEHLKSITADLTKRLEEAVRQSRTDMDSLFDENYVRTAEEGKFSVRSTRFFDAEVLPLLKQWVQADKRLIYVVAMDRNGYMPTHLMPARALVRMSDPVSLNGAKSTVLLGQAFRRPIAAGGELAIDVAMPIMVGSRHWGCLRLGYLPDVGA
ncbi:MAG: methyl-accepting chemotaxis protein [Nitrospirae bacterium]|nr:methyl-accepting chemotaxis protein [Nitrospirota bacterium]